MAAEVVELTNEEKALARGEDVENAAAIGARDAEAKVEAQSPETNTEQTGTDAVPSQDGSGTEAARSATQPEAWVNDEYRELAQSYGLDDDALKEFTSPDEFRRATKIFDRQLAATVERQRVAQQQAAQEQARKQVEETAKTPPAPAAPKFTKHDLEKLKQAGYDEESLTHFKIQNEMIDAFEASEKEKSELRDQTKSLNEQFGQFRQVMAQAESQRRANQFHEAVDALGDERFGKTIGTDGKFSQLSKAADENRRKLHDTAELLAQGMIAQQRAAGVEPSLPPLPVMLQRARALAFASDIRTEERKKVQAEVSAQSKRVRQVAQLRQPNGEYAKGEKNVPQSINDRVQETLSNPRLASALEKFREAKNGAAT